MHSRLIKGVVLAHRHTTTEVSAEHVAIQKAVEEEILYVEEARQWLAEIEVDEEQENAEEDKKCTCHLLAVLENAYCLDADNAESFHWNSDEGINLDHESKVEKKITKMRSNVFHIEISLTNTYLENKREEGHTR